MGRSIDIPPTTIRQTGEAVAAQIAQASRPGPVPTAGAGSAIDGAAATVAGAVIKNVAAASAELAPQSAEIAAKSEAAATQFQAKDAQNAAKIKESAAGVQERPPASGGGGVRAASLAGGGEDWFEGDDNIDRSPAPIGTGSGPGVIAGSGVPAELMSAGDGWDDWYDSEEDLVVPVLPTGPSGAGPGPGVIPGSGVPPGLV